MEQDRAASARASADEAVEETLTEVEKDLPARESGSSPQANQDRSVGRNAKTNELGRAKKRDESRPNQMGEMTDPGEPRPSPSSNPKRRVESRQPKSVVLILFRFTAESVTPATPAGQEPSHDE